MGAGVEPVLTRVDALAKGWLLALVEDAPLEEAAAILSGEVARDGPRICDAVVRAVCDEADLRRLEPGGVLAPLVARAGELAGARSAEAAAHAVETLKDVVWSALRSQLAQGDPDLLIEVAERLALVADLVRAAVLRRGGGQAPRERPGQEPGERPARVAPLRVAGADRPAGRREQDRVARRPPEEGGGMPGLEGGGGAAGAVRGGAAPEVGPLGGGQTNGEEADEAIPGRGLERDPLWVGALRDEIVRASRARSPLSLLLVELEEAERLVAVEPHGEATATFGRFAQAVRTSVRRRDVLACETDSRAWIIARDTGRAGAQALGSRIATAVPSEESWRGAPLSVSVGLAVLGEDGHHAAALIDAAEQTRFAAEASGIGMLTGEPEDGVGIVTGEPEDGASDPERPEPGPSLAS